MNAVLVISLCLAAMVVSTCPASALAAEPIVVGRSLPLSGPLRSYGEAKRDGGNAYIKKTNAAGGVGGRPIELVTLDDAYTPDKTIENLTKLAAEHQPMAFLGLFGLPTVAAAPRPIRCRASTSSAIEPQQDKE